MADCHERNEPTGKILVEKDENKKKLKVISMNGKAIF
jgi:hypothetical protein